MARTTVAQQKLARRKLLATAAEHFAANGFEGANVNTIATEAGFAKGTIYNYFSSKLDLLSAVLQYGSEVAAARFVRRQRGELRADLLALTREDVRIVRQNQAFMRVVAREMLTSRPETKAAVDSGLQPFEEAVADILERAVERGEIDSQLQSRYLGRSFVALLMSLYVTRWRSDGDWPTWDELPHIAVSLFLDGVANDRVASQESPSL